MPRFFNIAGPNVPERHYTLPALQRLPRVRELIDDGLYFVVHAPRQAGKTTTLRTLANELTSEGHYAAVLVSMESADGYQHDPPAAERTILQSWRESARMRLPPNLQPPPWPESEPGQRIRSALQAWCRASPRPLVLFIDEIDTLYGNLLLSVLRQIRDGYDDRPAGFPWSLALMGMRNVRDYKIAAGGEDRAHSASPFNIAAEALTLNNFTREEVDALYGQHTQETGQVFLSEAIDRAYTLTQGQPWLVNALARQLTKTLVQDRSQAITEAHVEEAKEILIRRRDTHLDSLAERLREPRVRAIIEPMLSGEHTGDIPEDDIHFVTDLGLLKLGEGKRLEVANPIYKEIIIRQLSFGLQTGLPPIQPSWLTPAGKLNKDALLKAFLDFWRQNGAPMMNSAPYHEAAPHLVLMAFLHRVVNGGTIEREYAIGSGRMDLCVRYGGEILGIEIKVWRDGRPDPEAEGMQQLDQYLAGIGQESGWLVVFDRRSGAKAVEERTGSVERVMPSGRRVVVVRG